ncbi:hypothetical protein G5714_019715 [Onychostoma macrolepis]|uniref:Uncharacterized protein n=1 Tax=Onychostoma macrolepis TaxID=369639 RepID=A0A7J6BX65_9TELE|nr:hypothetical protein G5714_019715 [Onychostoma macrolepis]
MPHCFWRSCRAPLHTADGHGECVSYLAAHAETALTETECPHCEDMSLASLHSRIVFFSESDSAPRTLPLPSSQEPVRKKQRGRGCKRAEMSELTPAQTPHTSLSPTRAVLPVFFSRPDQCPSAAASDLVSFGGSEDEVLDNSVSLAASDAEELSGSVASVTDGWPEVWIFSLFLAQQDCYIFTAKTFSKPVGQTLKTEKQVVFGINMWKSLLLVQSGDPGDDRHDISSEEVLTDPELVRHEGFQDEGEGKRDRPPVYLTTVTTLANLL